MRTVTFPILAAMIVIGLTTLAAGQGAVGFNRDVRPILSAKCFECHGPDEAGRQAGLRLDMPLGDEDQSNGAVAIVPGDAEHSEVYQRMISSDAGLRMPPPSSHKTLKPAEIETVRRWIEQGAEYETHWAFEPPQRPPVPSETKSAWAKGAIDRFLLHRMQKVGLNPSSPAELAVLARRSALDLVGVSPLPEEVDEFIADAEHTNLDAAYERWVDRLIASPRYGERWAALWLDLARYADSNGYEKDRPRSIWAYRDWVIDSLNQDMPFDRFTIEQIAGDLLPGADQSTRIATGFHRNTMLNEEGGIDPLEYRFLAMADRVATTGVTWLGLTLGCAQCHTHKYDPISHHEYYQFMAFLNNADEPDLELRDAELESQQRVNLARAESLLRELPARWPMPEAEDLALEVDLRDDASPSRAEISEAAARAAFQLWLERRRRESIRWTPLKPISAKSNSPLLTILDDRSILASGDITKIDIYRVTYELPKTNVTAVRLEVLPHESLPGRGPGMTYYEGTKGDFFMGDFRLSADGSPIKLSDASHSYAVNKYEHEVAARLTIDDNPLTGWSVDGGSGKRHTAVYSPAEPISHASSLSLAMSFGRHFASSLGRFRLSVTGDSGPIKAEEAPLAVEHALSITPEDLTTGERNTLWEYFLLTTPELSKHSAEIRQLREPLEMPTTLVLRERPEGHPRDTHLHHRGEYMQPEELVTPAVPAVLHSFKPQWPRNRLGLARWLAAPENPMTARVVMNRHWAAMFGKGIVRTVDDFGVLASTPTHPRLLDWLAVEFRESGWSLKHMHKLMAMSAAYRQSSHVTSELLAKDPENLWLARASRARLPAEVIRDNMLNASGLLSDKRGGPGVHPPQPAGVTEVAFGNPKWEVSQGEDRYRRSIYTFKKRSAPFAMYDVFDAPSGESCKARRDISNTPMQALTLLNDEMFTEMTQALGRLLADYEAGNRSRAAYAFRRVLTRPPTDAELAELLEFAADQRRRFESGDADAVAVAGTTPSDDIPPNTIERAVWTSTARVLIGLDEAITRN